MSKQALITGITGQDGSYLAEHLLELGYVVHGFYRRSSVDNLCRIRHLLPNLCLHRGDLADHASLIAAIKTSKPDELYHLADQDNVDWSYETPSYSCDITSRATSWLLEAVKGRGIKLFVPISATVFGSTPPPQYVASRLSPLSPYACAKAHAWHLCQYHRESYNTHVSCGVLYNHDSPRRGDEYLLHRLCKAAVRGEVIELSDLEQVIEVGFAGDFVKSFAKLLQLSPQDVILSGSQLTLSDWASLAGCKVRLVERKYRPGPRQELISHSSPAWHERTWTGLDLVNAIKEKFK